MPGIASKNIGIAFDMNGCPNRCRHCYLGCASGSKVSIDRAKLIVKNFKDYIIENKPFIENIAVSTWFREPDYSDNYKELYKLEEEWSDGKPYRYELLSIWRLARDIEYGRWAKEIRTEKCQISFFGMRETNDWFYRREGAFKDAILATERLLDVGIKPRWQLFLTKKIIPELGNILNLVKKLKLRERVAALDGEFEIFLHTPGPDGNARRIEYLRPDIEETKNIPSEIIEESKLYLKVENLWYKEDELIKKILEVGEEFPYAYKYPDALWLLIAGNLDVFANFATLEPWWKLGNLNKDSIEKIFQNFENNTPLGLYAIYNVSSKELIKKFGNPNSTLIYTNKDDLLSLYLGNFLEWKLRRKGKE